MPMVLAIFANIDIRVLEQYYMQLRGIEWILSCVITQRGNRGLFALYSPFRSSLCTWENWRLEAGKVLRLSWRSAPDQIGLDAWPKEAKRDVQP